MKTNIVDIVVVFESSLVYMWFLKVNQYQKIAAQGLSRAMPATVFLFNYFPLLDFHCVVDRYISYLEN